MATNHRTKHGEELKAGAMICPKCCTAYLEAQVDIEYDGEILHDVKVLRCPTCDEEVFTPEQHVAIIERVRTALEASEAERKTGNR